MLPMSCHFRRKSHNLEKVSLKISRAKRKSTLIHFYAKVLSCVYTVQLHAACKYGLLTTPLFWSADSISCLIGVGSTQLVLLQTINHRMVVLFIYQNNSIGFVRVPLVNNYRPGSYSVSQNLIYKVMFHNLATRWSILKLDHVLGKSNILSRCSL